MTQKKQNAIETEEGTTKAVAMKVSTVSIIVNLSLSVFELIAGLVAGSGAMISDAVHSASDVFSTFIVMIGVTISDREADEKHPYGHERMECVASMLLAIVLAVTGVGIGYGALKKITGGNYENLQVPGMMALLAAVVSIAVKEWMYWYTRAAAKNVNSGALMADAWHHRSDALSSIGAFVGIFGARMGFPVMDPLAGFVICLFILKAAFDIFKDSIDKMVDRACPPETEEKMREIILAQEGVLKLDDLKSRLFGAKVYVDVEISVDGNKTLLEAHDIAQNVHEAIETGIPNVKHCMVHENPYPRRKSREDGSSLPQ